MGFKDALKKETVNTDFGDSQHEVVEALRDFVKETGYVNAHAGLTSSDVIDNVRLQQCALSAVRVQSSLHDLFMQMELVPNIYTPCIGYTHWQAASSTHMDRRIETWKEPLSFLHEEVPPLHAKPLLGATGTGGAINILFGAERHQKEAFLPGHLLRGFDFALQSSYGVDELRQAQWLDSVVGWCHKIAQDIRFLCHTGEMSIVKDSEYRGSSAMPKKQNPIEAEQVCSLARLQPNFTRQLWDSMSFNGLERTLDTSACMRVTLPAMYNNADYVLRKMVEIFTKLEINVAQCSRVLRENFEIANVEEVMALRIKNGESRFKVFEELQ